MKLRSNLVCGLFKKNLLRGEFYDMTKQDKQEDNIRHLPQAIEAEEAVIACALCGGRETMMDLVRYGVVEAAFFKTSHQVIWRLMVDLVEDGQPLDEILLLERLKAKEPDEAERIGIGTIYSIQGKVETPASARFFANLVIGAWNKRQLIRQARKVQELAHTPGDSFDEVRKAVQGPLTEMGRISVTEDKTDLRDELKKLMKRKRAEFSGTVEEVPEEFRFSLGMPSNEKKLGYIDRRVEDNYIVVAAPSSRGKSTLMRQSISWNLKLHKDWNIVVFIQEGGATQFMHLMACGMSGVRNRDHHEWLTERINKGAEQAKKANARVKAYFEFLDFLHAQLNVRFFLFEKDRCITDIVNRSHELAARLGGIDGVYVDYIQNTESSKKSGANREQEVSDITGKLQGLQVSLGCPLVTGSQLSEDGKARESRQIFNDSTRFLKIDRPAKDASGNDQTEVGRKQYFQTLEQQKFRNGTPGMVFYNFNCECGQFLDFGNIPMDKRGRPKKATAEGATSF